MNIYVYAMKMEKEGENYYRELEAKVKNPGLKKILNFLANQEVKHYNVLAEMSKENPTPTMAEEALLNDVKTVFSGFKENTDVADFETDEVAFYEKARDLEKAAFDFYTQKAEQTMIDTHKEIFLRIAGEEKQHIDIMEALIDFTASPEKWIEDAEWNNIGEEY
ncbi:MAG: ferritin family protein [bacterium]|nr:ferritin family protein [bacterium]MBU1918538.1 ferritin family protein [bacterium]